MISVGLISGNLLAMEELKRLEQEKVNPLTAHAFQQKTEKDAATQALQEKQKAAAWREVKKNKIPAAEQENAKKIVDNIAPHRFSGSRDLEADIKRYRARISELEQLKEGADAQMQMLADQLIADYKKLAPVLSDFIWLKTTAEKAELFNKMVEPLIDEHAISGKTVDLLQRVLKIPDRLELKKVTQNLETDATFYENVLTTINNNEKKLVETLSPKSKIEPNVENIQAFIGRRKAETEALKEQKASLLWKSIGNVVKPQYRAKARKAINAVVAYESEEIKNLNSELTNYRNELSSINEAERQATGNQKIAFQALRNDYNELIQKLNDFKQFKVELGKAELFEQYIVHYNIPYKTASALRGMAGIKRMTDPILKEWQKERDQLIQEIAELKKIVAERKKALQVSVEESHIEEPVMPSTPLSRARPDEPVPAYI